MVATLRIRYIESYLKSLCYLLMYIIKNTETYESYGYRLITLCT